MQRLILTVWLFSFPAWCLADVASDLLDAGITSSNILQVYTWGMGVVLTMWAIGWAAGVAVQVIKAL